MEKIHKKYNLLFLIIILLPFLWTALFGLSQMSMGMNGETVNCPFSNHSMSICELNPGEHIAEWQSMFTTTLPTQDTFTILSIILVLVALSTLKFWSRFSIPDIRHLHTRLFSRKKFHILNPLKEAFSQGILNPKLF